MTTRIARTPVALLSFLAATILAWGAGPAALAEPSHQPSVRGGAITPTAVGGTSHPGVTGPGGRLRIVAGGWSDNAVTAENGGHGHLKARSRTALVQTSDTTVSATNRAVAHAHCSDCRTVAVALEVVVATGSPDAPSFTNTATAVNQDCIRCETVAMAYQLVLLAPGVRISDAGVVRLNTIAAHVAAAVRSGAPVEDVIAAVDGLAAQAAQVLRDDVEAGAGSPAAAHRALARAHVAVHRSVDRT